MAYRSTPPKQDEYHGTGKAVYICLTQGCGEMIEGIDSVVKKQCDFCKSKENRQLIEADYVKK